MSYPSRYRDWSAQPCSHFHQLWHINVSQDGSPSPNPKGFEQTRARESREGF